MDSLSRETRGLSDAIAVTLGAGTLPAFLQMDEKREAQARKISKQNWAKTCKTLPPNSMFSYPSQESDATSAAAMRCAY